MKKLLSVLLLALMVSALAGIMPAQASGTIRYAKPGGQTSGDCASWATACALSYALSVAISGDQIWVAAGTHTPGPAREDSFSLKNNVGVYGGFTEGESNFNNRNWQTNPTILSGNNHNYRVVNSSATNASAVLDGFIITSGNANHPIMEAHQRGGGIYNLNGSPTLRNLTIENNYAYHDGGGMYNQGGSPTLENIFFNSNRANPDHPDPGNFPYGMGGGLHVESGSPVLQNVRFHNNRSVRGGSMSNVGGSNSIINQATFTDNRSVRGVGAMFNDNLSSPTLTDVRFERNQAGRNGGAIFNSTNSNPIIQRAYFIENRSLALFGGAIYYENSHNARIVNAVFYKNETTEGGGALYIFNSTNFQITNVTFLSNQTRTDIGGSVDGGAIANQDSTLSITNSILWNNRARVDTGTPINSQIVLVLAGTATVSHSIVDGGWTGSGNLSSNPRFVNPADGEVRLQGNSPAIDSGTNTNCPGVDIEGTTRPQQGNHALLCDMGAFEYTTSPTSVAITRQGSTPTDASAVTFRVTFGSPVTNVDTNDFAVVHISPKGTLRGTSIASVSGSGTTYDVTVNTGAGNGALRLRIPASATITGINNALLPLTGPESYFLLREQTFADVSRTQWYWPAIERLYAENITGGCTTTLPLHYCPGNSVTRAQMAIFLGIGTKGAGFSPPTDVPITFLDTHTHWARFWIESLRRDGITGGCGSGNYCPEDPVSRAQMAIFLLRARHGAHYQPPALSGGSRFADVLEAHGWAAAWIEQLAAENITSGCGLGNYCPDSPVTRAQMAVFLVSTLRLP